MSKLVKSLIIINGIMIPLVLAIIIFQMASTFINRQINDDEGIIVDESITEAKSDIFALQGLSYDSPVEICNSTNYCLPISVTAYEEARNLMELSSRASDISLSYDLIMNVIFMDKNYHVIGKLVDRKASVSQIELPDNGRFDKIADTTVKNIACLIGFEDTNNDGKLNSFDNHDLYITDLNGQNLTKATTGIDVKSFVFVNSGTKILIRFKERSDLKEEHKKVKFGLFDIVTSKFEELTGLNNSINDIERQLIN